MDGILERIRKSEGASQGSLNPKEELVIKGRSLFKVYLLIGTTTLLAFLSGFLLRIGEFGYGTFVFVVWATVLTVQSLALKKYVGEILLASGACTLGLVLPFLGAPLGYWGAMALIVFMLLIAVHNGGKRGSENMVKIRFSHATRPVIGLILIVGVVVMTFLFSVEGDAVFTENNVNRTVDLMVTPVLGGYIEDFSSSAKLEDMLESIALDQVNKSSGVENLTAFQKQLLVSQAAKDLGTSLEEKTGFDIKEKATVGANIHTWISERSSNLLDPNSPWGILILGAIILLLVKSIEIILYLPLGLLAFMLYELLVAFGFVTVQFETRDKEVIKLI